MYVDWVYHIIILYSSLTIVIGTYYVDAYCTGQIKNHIELNYVNIWFLIQILTGSGVTNWQTSIDLNILMLCCAVAIIGGGRIFWWGGEYDGTHTYTWFTNTLTLINLVDNYASFLPHFSLPRIWLRAWCCICNRSGKLLKYHMHNAFRIN